MLRSQLIPVVFWRRYFCVCRFLTSTRLANSFVPTSNAFQVQKPGDRRFLVGLIAWLLVVACPPSRPRVNRPRGYLFAADVLHLLILLILEL